MSRCPSCGAIWAPDHRFCPHDGTRLTGAAEAPTATETSGAGSGAPEMPEAGDVLDDKYALVRVIGTGGVGVVYEAQHLRIDRPVAIKVLRPGVVGDETQLVRFAEEARLAGQIGHENIVEILDLVTSEEGPPYMVMELLSGQSLASHLAENPVLRPERALHLAREVLSGLAAAHDKGIVHRDVKPGNIFIAHRDGRGEVIKLLDFGIARAIQTDLRLTAPGRAVGTAVFMPPEQIMASEVDEHADIYSIAAVLYLMLTGEPPFQGDTWAELARAKLSASVPPLRGFDPEVGLHLEHAIRRGLERNPEDRPSTALEYREELSRTLETIEARGELRPSRVPTIATGQKRRVAVLPFVVIPPAHPERWVGHALAVAHFDELTTRPGVRLINPEVVHAARCDDGWDCLGGPLAVANLVGAGYVLTGEVVLDDLDPRVETRVIEADSGEVVARNVQTGSLDELFRLQRATLDIVGRSFRIPPRGQGWATTLALVDFAGFREYVQVDRDALALAPTADPAELLGRVKRLIERHPDHPGLIRCRAELSIRRVVREARVGSEALVTAFNDLEALAARASTDPRVPALRAALRSTNRFFAPREALVLAEEARVLSGLEGALLLEQATALENMGSPNEAAMILGRLVGQDATCGPALSRLALLSLVPTRRGELDRDNLDRAEFLLRSAQRLADEEAAEGSRASSTRRGWAPVPELGPIEALAALRRGDRSGAEAALGELRAHPTTTTWSRLGLATAEALASRGAEALAALVALGPEIETRLERPGNEMILELAFAAPEVWLEALAEMSRRSTAAERLELILAVVLESRGDLEAALEILRPLSDSLHPPFQSFARARARRIEIKVTKRSRI